MDKLKMIIAMVKIVLTYMLAVFTPVAAIFMFFKEGYTSNILYISGVVFMSMYLAEKASDWHVSFLKKKLKYKRIKAIEKRLEKSMLSGLIDTLNSNSDFNEWATKELQCNECDKTECKLHPDNKKEEPKQ